MRNFGPAVCIPLVSAVLDCTQPGMIARRCAARQCCFEWQNYGSVQNFPLTRMYGQVQYPKTRCAMINLVKVACVLQLVFVVNPQHTAGQFQHTAGQLSTAVCVYIAGLCAKLPGCVEGHR